jgi:hypothetical protein
MTKVLFGGDQVECESGAAGARRLRNDHSGCGAVMLG